MRRLALVFVLTAGAAASADDWPQYLGPNRDGEWKETGILEKFPAGGPKVVWRAKVGQGYAGPAVADGKLYVADRIPADGVNLGSSVRGGKSGVERTLCLNPKTGEQFWKHEYPVEYAIQYPSGPRCTPTVDGDRVYVLGAMGHLHCYDTTSGKVLWSKDFVKEYDAKVNVWGFAAHPLVDGEKLICLVGGSGERVVVAFDKKTGKEVWASQNLQSDAGYSPPVIYDLAGRRTLVIWHGRGCAGLDPDTGKRIWYYPWQVQHALTAPMARKVGEDHLFLTAFYEGPVMLKVGPESTPQVVWKSKAKGERPDQSDGIHSIMPTSYVKTGHLYGVSSYGELLCQKADTGETLWKTRKPTVGTAADEGKPTRWGNAFLTPNGDRFFLFNEQGELVIAKLSPTGYTEIDRAKLIEPTNKMAGRPTVWCHPAYAGKRMFVRNDLEMICVELAAR
jgi:outer membrane protein assembly factor BamB